MRSKYRYQFMRTTIIALFCHTFILLLFSTTADGQETAGYKITGLVSDEQGKPLELVTVNLMRGGDSTILKSTLSDVAGRYLINGLTKGRYILKATSVGSAPVFSNIITLNEDQKLFYVPPLIMISRSLALSTVTITGSKPMIEKRDGKMVMNVENSIVATGNSALEVLARAPGVTIDKDDNIRLNGKEGVNVMINDKMTYLSAAQLATLLRATDGNSIKTIELMADPSVKYDASGNAGIINIRLKKNSFTGTNASAMLSGGYGKHGKGSSTVTLGHKAGKLNVFGTFNHTDGKNEFNMRQLRVVPDSGNSNTYFDQHSAAFRTSHNNSYQFGADLVSGTYNTVGFMISGYFNSSLSLGDSYTKIRSKPEEFASAQDQLSNKQVDMNNFSFNINDNYKLDTLGQELSIDYDHSRYNFHSNYTYDTRFFLRDGSIASPLVSLKQQTPSTININTAKLDYVLPLKRSTKLEMGAKYSRVNTDNDLQAQRLNNDTYVNDTTLSNRFRYDEQVIAGYINLKKDLGKTSVQAGLRSEHTASDGDLINTGYEVKRTYTNFFPSLSMTHKLNDKHEISFSYSKRVDRPAYNDLNPFIFYIDQYSYSVGNPFLNAQYTNKVEFDYAYNQSLNVSLGYSHAYNFISEVALTDAKTKRTIYTDLNFQAQNYYNMNVSSPYTVARWWKGNFNAIAFYSKFRSDSLLGAQYERGIVSFHLQTSQYLTFFKVYRVEILGNYDSPYINGSYRYGHNLYSDIGFSRPFVGKKANLKLSLTDVFNFSKTTMVARYQTNDITLHLKPETRVARITFTYNFGTSPVKALRHTTGADDEKSRAG